MDNEIEHLSASGIKSFRDCPKQFWYKYISDVESPDEGEVEHFSIGNSVHGSLEEILGEEDIENWTEERILSRVREIERGLDYNYDDSEKVQTCLESASKYIAKYVEEVITVEDRFEMDLKGVDFVGYADLIADIDDGDESLDDVIIDWKTGKENDEWKERVQGGMYAKMYREINGTWPESIQFVYLNEGSLSTHNRVSDGEVMWNDHQNKYWDEISGDISDISNAAFNDDWQAKPESSKCHFCDYKLACSDYIGSEECEPRHLSIGDGL